jgi:hypothetical protein
MEKSLIERVTRLEAQMEYQTEASQELTEAVRELTAVLNKGKGVFWVVGTLVSVGMIIGGIIAWAVDLFK